MKKILAAFMMVAMVMCFMPTMAFAGEGDEVNSTPNTTPGGDGTPAATYAVKVILSTKEVVDLDKLNEDTDLNTIVEKVKEQKTDLSTVDIYGYVLAGSDADTTGTTGSTGATAATGGAQTTGGAALNPSQINSTSAVDSAADTTVSIDGKMYGVKNIDKEKFKLFRDTVLVAKVTKKSSGGSSSGGSGGYVAPSTDSVVDSKANESTGAAATTTATVKPATTTAADGTKTTTATVSTTTATKIVENAVANKTTEVVINAGTATTVTETAAGAKTEVAIPATAISQVAEKTEAAVTIKSDAAVVTLDKEAVAAVAETAGTTGEVKLVVATVAQDENKVQVELKLETANGAVSDFKGGSASVTVKLSAALAAKNVVCVYIDDDGVYHKVEGTKNADGTFTFKTGHFSSYAVMTEEDADKVLAEQAAKAKELTKTLKLKARSTKTAKGNIKVTLSLTKGDIKAIEDLGYTVKYKFYRSTKKASSYKAKIEGTGKTYTNTSGKKGTKYYYKVRVMVYDAEGTLVAKSALTQCKYACRIR